MNKTALSTGNNYTSTVSAVNTGSISVHLSGSTINLSTMTLEMERQAAIYLDQNCAPDLDSAMPQVDFFDDTFAGIGLTMEKVPIADARILDGIGEDRSLTTSSKVQNPLPTMMQQSAGTAPSQHAVRGNNDMGVHNSLSTPPPPLEAVENGNFDRDLDAQSKPPLCSTSVQSSVDREASNPLENSTAATATSGETQGNVDAATTPGATEESNKPGPSGGWLQLENTITPFVYREGDKRYLPMSVVQHAAGLCKGMQIVNEAIEEREIKDLNDLCGNAGICFKFSQATRLVALEVVKQHEPQIAIRQLPMTNPFDQVQRNDSGEAGNEKDAGQEVQASPMSLLKGTVSAAELVGSAGDVGPTRNECQSAVPPSPQGPVLQPQPQNFQQATQQQRYFRNPPGRPPMHRMAYPGQGMNNGGGPVMTGPQLGTIRYAGAPGGTNQPSGPMQQPQQVYYRSPRQRAPSTYQQRMLNDNNWAGSAMGGRYPSTNEFMMRTPSPGQPQAIRYRQQSPGWVNQRAQARHSLNFDPDVEITGMVPGRQAAYRQNQSASAPTTPLMQSNMRGGVIQRSMTPQNYRAGGIRQPRASAASIRALEQSVTQCLACIRPSVVSGRKVSVFERPSRAGLRYVLVEAASRVFFPNVLLEEVVHALQSVLHAPVETLNPVEERAFIRFYSLPVGKLKCDKIIQLDVLLKYIPQLNYIFTGKTATGTGASATGSGRGGAQGSSGRMAKSSANQNHRLPLTDVFIDLCDDEPSGDKGSKRSAVESDGKASPNNRVSKKARGNGVGEQFVDLTDEDGQQEKLLEVAENQSQSQNEDRTILDSIDAGPATDGGAEVSADNSKSGGTESGLNTVEIVRNDTALSPIATDGDEPGIEGRGRDKRGEEVTKTPVSNSPLSRNLGPNVLADDESGFSSSSGTTIYSTGGVHVFVPEPEYSEGAMSPSRMADGGDDDGDDEGGDAGAKETFDSWAES